MLKEFIEYLLAFHQVFRNRTLTLYFNSMDFRHCLEFFLLILDNPHHLLLKLLKDLDLLCVLLDQVWPLGGTLICP